MRVEGSGFRVQGMGGTLHGPPWVQSNVSPDISFSSASSYEYLANEQYPSHLVLSGHLETETRSPEKIMVST